jgi:hypothetical protein
LNLQSCFTSLPLYQEVRKIPSTLAEPYFGHDKTYPLNLNEQISLTQLPGNNCLSTPTGDIVGYPNFIPQSAAKPQTKPLLCMSPHETNVSQTTAATSTLKIDKHSAFLVTEKCLPISEFDLSVPPPNTPYSSPVDLKTVTEDKILVGKKTPVSLLIEKAVQSVGSITANFGTQTCDDDEEQVIE